MLRTRLIALVLVVTLASGCATVDTYVNDPVITPTPPVENLTAYTQPLQCLGRMYEAYQEPKAPLIVAVQPMMDTTASYMYTSAEIPKEFTLMVESAVNSISPFIRVANVEHDFLFKEQTLGGQIGRMVPQIVLRGGVPEFDKALSIAAKKKDAGGFFGNGRGKVDVETNLGTEEALSRLALDLFAHEYATMTTRPNAHASLKIEVQRKVRERGWSITVYGWGFGDVAQNKVIQGRHEALRVMVEYAVLQTMGRYFNLPYWRCLGNDAKDDPAVRTFRQTQYLQQNPRNQIGMVQELLVYHGFKEVKQTFVVDTVTQRALDEYAQRNAAVLKLQKMEDLYFHLFATLPISRGPSGDRDWRLTFGVNPARSPAAKAAVVNASIASADGLSRHAPGEAVQLAVRLDQDGYLYCFLRDGDRQISRIFPNRFERAAHVSVRRAASIPGTAGFSIRAEKRGNAGEVMCAAMPQDAVARWDTRLKGPDLTTLPVQSLDEVKSLIAAATPEARFALYTIEAK